MNPFRWLIRRVDVSDRNGHRALKGWMLFILFFLYAPVIIVVILSFTPREVPSFPLDGFSLRWYAVLIPPNQDEALVSAFFTSLKIGIISAIGAGIVGTAAALGLVRYEFSSRWLDSDLLNTIFITPIVVPWIVTGIAVLVLYNIVGIEGTFLSVVIGHILIALPFVILVVSSSLYGFDRSLEEAAKNLGANNLQAFYEVTLPIISPGIIAGMLFAFTISFDNFTQTFFWAGNNTQTLPLVIYGKIRFGIDPSVNSIGTIIIVFSLAIAMIAEKLSSRIL
jgi:spermidine/putrescine transport system permease protein